MVRTIKIPKRVGALKIPKKVRKQAKRAIKTAASPMVRDFATAAMAAAGRARRESAGEAPNESGPRETHRVHHEMRMEIDGSKVAEAFRTAAIDGFRRFLEGFEEGLRNAQGAEKAEARAAPEPPVKPAKPRAPAKPKPGAKPRKPAANSPASPDAAGSA